MLFFPDRDVTPVPPSPPPISDDNDLTMADLYREKANSLFATVGSSKSEKLRTVPTGKEILKRRVSDENDADEDDDDDVDENSTLGAGNDNDNDTAEEEEEEEDGDDDDDDNYIIGLNDNCIFSNSTTISGGLKLTSTNIHGDNNNNNNDQALPSTSAGSGNQTLVSSSLDSVALSEEYISPPVPWNMAVVDRILSGKDIKSSSTLSSGHSTILIPLLLLLLSIFLRQKNKHHLTATTTTTGVTTASITSTATSRSPPLLYFFPPLLLLVQYLRYLS